MSETKSCQHGFQKDPFTVRCDIPKVEKWSFDKQGSRKDSYVFHHEHERSDATIKVFRPMHGQNWCVSILGNRRFQPEYLAGGNSMKHDATRQEAMELAKAYMLLHPMGRKEY